MYFMSVKATFAVAVRTRKVSRRPCTCPTTGNILILHKTLIVRDSGRLSAGMAPGFYGTQVTGSASQLAHCQLVSVTYLLHMYSASVASGLYSRYGITSRVTYLPPSASSFLNDFSPMPCTDIHSVTAVKLPKLHLFTSFSLYFAIFLFV